MSEFNIKTLKLEGQLSKFTNIVTGYKYRYFVVKNALARLDYFMSEDMKHQKPRGSIELENAVISPSEEDSTTFLIHTIDNELFKLRAQDAKERQHWVNVLRFVSQSFKDQGSGEAKKSHKGQSQIVQSNKCTYELVREVLSKVRHHQLNLDQSIDKLPLKGNYISRHDKEILILKATARACTCCVSECVNLIKNIQNKTLSTKLNAFGAKSIARKQMHLDKKIDLKQNISSYPFSQLSLSPTDIYNGTKSDYVVTVLPKSSSPSPATERKRRSSTQPTENSKEQLDGSYSRTVSFTAPLPNVDRG